MKKKKEEEEAPDEDGSKSSTETRQAQLLLDSLTPEQAYMVRSELEKMIQDGEDDRTTAKERMRAKKLARKDKRQRQERQHVREEEWIGQSEHVQYLKPDGDSEDDWGSTEARHARKRNKRSKHRNGSDDAGDDIHVHGRGSGSRRVRMKEAASSDGQDDGSDVAAPARVPAREKPHKRADAYEMHDDVYGAPCDDERNQQHEETEGQQEWSTSLGEARSAVDPDDGVPFSNDWVCAFRKRIVRLMNVIREDPCGVANAYFGGGPNCEGLAFAPIEGARVVKEVHSVLCRLRKPRARLALSSVLCEVADSMADAIVARAVMGAGSVAVLTPREAVEQVGSCGAYVTKSVVYGGAPDKALSQLCVDIIMRQLVCDDIPKRSLRTNMLELDASMVGVGLCDGHDSGLVTVLVFVDTFEPKVTRASWGGDAGIALQPPYSRYLVPSGGRASEGGERGRSSFQHGGTSPARATNVSFRHHTGGMNGDGGNGSSMLTVEQLGIGNSPGSGGTAGDQFVSSVKRAAVVSRWQAAERAMAMRPSLLTKEERLASGLRAGKKVHRQVDTSWNPSTPERSGVTWLSGASPHRRGSGTMYAPVRKGRVLDRSETEQLAMSFSGLPELPDMKYGASGIDGKDLDDESSGHLSVSSVDDLTDGDSDHENDMMVSEAKERAGRPRPGLVLRDGVAVPYRRGKLDMSAVRGSVWAAEDGTIFAAPMAGRAQRAASANGHALRRASGVSSLVVASSPVPSRRSSLSRVVEMGTDVRAHVDMSGVHDHDEASGATSLRKEHLGRSMTRGSDLQQQTTPCVIARARMPMSTSALTPASAAVVPSLQMLQNKPIAGGFSDVSDLYAASKSDKRWRQSDTMAAKGSDDGSVASQAGYQSILDRGDGMQRNKLRAVRQRHLRGRMELLRERMTEQERERHQQHLKAMQSRNACESGDEDGADNSQKGGSIVAGRVAGADQLDSAYHAVVCPGALREERLVKAWNPDSLLSEAATQHVVKALATSVNTLPNRGEYAGHELDGEGVDDDNMKQVPYPTEDDPILKPLGVCAVCKHAVFVAVTVIGGHVYHTGCVACYVCRKTIVETSDEDAEQVAGISSVDHVLALPSGMGLAEGKPVCMRDFVRLHAPACCVCSESMPLDNLSNVVVRAGKSFHRECAGIV